MSAKSINYQEICHHVCRIARRAGAFIAEQRLTFSSDRVELKGRHNLVSYVDKQAEKMIIADLQSILPNAFILGEEGGVTSNTPGVSVQHAQEQGVGPSAASTCEYNNSYPTAPVSATEYCWVIDPLDGTTNFVHGMPPYCVSIALMLGEEVVVGVIFEITANECFYAWQGSDAYLNDSVITVSKETQVENSLVITGMAYQSDFDREELNRHFDYFNVNSHGARRTGSAAANLAYVAAGRAECFFQRGLAPWDVAAGVLIVERAKGRVSDYSAQDGYVFGQQVVASNGVMHQQFLELVR